MDDHVSSSAEEARQGASRQRQRSGPNGDADGSTYTIGDIAREFGFTLRAIRFYEEKGLVSPRRMGNRRLYSPREYARFEIIAQGKRMGLPVADIRAILRAGDAKGGERAMLEAALDKALARIEAIGQEREMLETNLREAQDAVGALRQKLAGNA